jgi:hypothetical protein
MSSARCSGEHANDSFAESLLLALSTGSAPQSQRPQLPLPTLPSQGRGSATHHVVTAMDSRGRLADRSSLRVLHWGSGLRLDISSVHGVVIVVARGGGGHTVTRQGHLRLPLPIRRSCGLNGGDRLLLVAFPDRGLLLAYTTAAVNAMILAYHSAHPGGLER